jgi:hypothetical protein
LLPPALSRPDQETKVRFLPALAMSISVGKIELNQQKSA